MNPQQRKMDYKQPKTSDIITTTTGEQFRVLTVQPDHVTGLQYCKNDTIQSPAIKLIKLKDIEP